MKSARLFATIKPFYRVDIVQNQQDILSRKLVQAYRTWFNEAEQLEASHGGGRTVYMDDLSGIEDNPQLLDGSDWRSIFKEAINKQQLFPDDFVRKIRESLHYFENRKAKPRLSDLIISGGVVGKNIENDLQRYSQLIEQLENESHADFPDFQGTPMEYAKDLASQGESFIKTFCPQLRFMQYSLEEAPSNSLFLAQVITREPGNIVCQLMPQIKVTSLFAYIIIHEIVGHVLHFTQLKDSKIKLESPHLLLLSLHTHESFFIEGIAQIITYFLLVKSSWKFAGSYHVKLNCVKQMKLLAILHLVTAEILEEKSKIEDAVVRHLELDPTANPSGSFQERFLT